MAEHDPAAKAWTVRVKTYGDVSEAEASALRAFIQKALEDAPSAISVAWRSVILEA